MSKYLEKLKTRAEYNGYKAEINGNNVIVTMRGINVIVDNSKQLDKLLKEEM